MKIKYEKRKIDEIDKEIEQLKKEKEKANKPDYSGNLIIPNQQDYMLIFWKDIITAFIVGISIIISILLMGNWFK